MYVLARSESLLYIFDCLRRTVESAVKIHPDVDREIFARFDNIADDPLERSLAILQDSPEIVKLSIAIDSNLSSFDTGFFQTPGSPSIKQVPIRDQERMKGYLLAFADAPC
jgi:hypothetical protein